MKLSNVRSNMEQILFRAQFTIEEGKIEEYKKLVQDTNDRVDIYEPRYSIYSIRSPVSNLSRYFLASLTSYSVSSRGLIPSHLHENIP